MATFSITLQDIKGETPEDDGFSYSFDLLPDETDRLEYDGLTQAVLTGLILHNVVKDPVKLEKLMAIADEADMMKDLEEAAPATVQ